MPQAFSCTTVSLKGVVGKSYDWGQKDANVLINKARVGKKSLVIKPGDVPASWTSRYASVTFNQYGQEFPLGGMNEKGLVVEIMVLGNTTLPPSDTRETANELQWIQYQLDNFEKVQEAVVAEKSLRISKVYADVHYLMCDARGECATFEYLEGNPEAKIHTGTTLPYAALTNDTYQASLDYLKTFLGFGGSTPIPLAATSSRDRFVVAASATQTADSNLTSLAFDTLSRVQVAGHTKFNIVYDQKNLVASFRTSSFPTIKSIRLGEISASCKRPVVFTPMQIAGEGDLTASLQEYSLADNKALVENTVAELGLPAALQKAAWSYPSTTSCLE